MNNILFILVVSLIVINDAKSQTRFDSIYLKHNNYIFDGLEKIMLDDVFTVYKHEFGLTNGDEMIESMKNVETSGAMDIKYKQFYDGYEVEGSSMFVRADKGIVLSVRGLLIKGLEIDTEILVNEDEAFAAAINYIGAEKYKWNEVFFDTETGNEVTYPKPKGYLLIAKKRGDSLLATKENYELCWKFTIEAVEPYEIVDIYINSKTGEVYTTNNPLKDAYMTSGSIWTWYDGYWTNIITRTCALCTRYRLEDMDRNLYISKFDLPGDFIYDGNNSWLENETKTEASAYWSVQRAWEYYYHKHGRSGSDNNKRNVRIYTEMPDYYYISVADYVPPSNPSDWDYIRLRKNNTSISPPGVGYSAAILDILAHEYTHAMINASSELGNLDITDYDARALNEGFADIFGMLAEGWVKGTPDWSIGENSGITTRYFSNPNLDIGIINTNNGSGYGGSPSTYLQPGYWSDPLVWGTSTNVHANGGTLRRWAYVLANGGSIGFNNIQPMGKDFVEQLSYITMTWWLWANVNYLQAANQIVEAAKAHWGTCSDEHLETEKALRALGLGANIPYVICLLSIDGTNVVHVDDQMPVSWKINIQPELEAKQGRFDWNIPDGWNATVSGNTLTLNQLPDDISSKIISVDYITEDEVYNTNKAIHFSNEHWNEPKGNEFAIKHLNSLSDELESTKIYPNPASTEVLIMLPYDVDNALINIIDLNGKTIMVKSINRINSILDIKELSSGLYIININNDGKTINKKLTVIK